MKSFYIKLLSIIIIISVGGIAYSNSFFCSFHLDDFSSIVNNPYIKDINNLPYIWKFLPRRFILYLSLAFNYHINGLQVFGYHLFNFVVHGGAALLVWWLTRLTFLTPTMKEEKIAGHSDIISLFTGLVFVTHPVQTEAVTYIVQRAASMATLLYLASLIFYVKSRLLQDKQPSGYWKSYYVASLATAVGAMFTKEIAITLPLSILLYEFSFFRTKKCFHWGLFSPFLFVVPLIMFLTGTGAERLPHLLSAPGISPMHYFLTQVRVIFTYLRLIALPINQNIDYDYPVFKNILETPVVFSLVSLLTILFFTKRLYLKYRMVFFSIFWFFLVLLPESSIFPIKDVIFEHRLYLPLAGYSIFGVSSLYYLLGKNDIKWMVLALVMVIACNAVLTYQRNKVWKDDVTLWDDAVRKSPHKARPYYSRGTAYLSRGNLIQSIADFNNAIKLNPCYPEAYVNRGISYYAQGNFKQAISDYNEAIKLNPQYAEAYYNRGNSYYRRGDFMQAVSDYHHAIELDPKDADSYINQALTYYQLREYDESWADVHQAETLGGVVNFQFMNRLKKASGRE